MLDSAAWTSDHGASVPEIFHYCHLKISSMTRSASFDQTGIHESISIPKVIKISASNRYSVVLLTLHEIASQNALNQIAMVSETPAAFLVCRPWIDLSKPSSPENDESSISLFQEPIFSSFPVCLAAR